MKEFIKKILQQLALYHPLQSLYRSAVDFAKNKYYHFAYSKFKGKGLNCNFCGAAYKKFVPEYPEKNIAGAINSNEVIAGYGEHVFCPNCMSKNRERLVLAVIQSMLIIENKSILHFSPEKNLYNYLKTRAIVTTVDIMPGFYKNIDKTILHADATNLTFKNEHFDCIIANHILEHIPEDKQAMQEMFRVLKTGGVAILQVPYSIKLSTTIEEPFINDPKKQEQLYGQKDHVRIYALTDYVNRLQQTGFNVKILSPETLTPFKVYAIQENESVILCYK